MHKIIVYCIAVLSLMVIFTYETTDLKGIQVSYRDLMPDARKQVDCLADNIYFEARSEPVAGQKAVALVTMNRVESKMFPRSICGVVKDQSNKVCQFSWWCESPNKSKSIVGVRNREYDRIKCIALDVYLNYGRTKDITGGALFYHADYVEKQKIGVKKLKQTTKIGKHIFYKV